MLEVDSDMEEMAGKITKVVQESVMETAGRSERSNREKLKSKKLLEYERTMILASTQFADDIILFAWTEKELKKILEDLYREERTWHED